MNAEAIGKRLIDLRGKRLVKDVAKALGISASALSMYETGQRVPRDEIKIRLARYYDRTVDSIFFNE